MARPNLRNRRLLVGLGVSVIVASASAWAIARVRSAKVPAVAAERVPVRRIDLDARLTAGGRVESAKKTLIECELENLQYSNEGRTISAGVPTILEIVEEGVTVHRDDVLCRLDSSGYEELVRQQELKLQQAKNDRDKSELDVKSAELGLAEYRDGNLPELIQFQDGQIVLARSEVARQGDRVAWAETMLKNGYYSGAQMSAERDRMLRAEVALANALGQQSLTRRFKAPIALRRLEMAVTSAKSSLSFQDLRLRRTESLLAKFRKQVDLCTVRAPHDGFVIYANEGGGAPRVEVGARVYQKMDLFFLPDLADMEVEAVLNESIVDRVKEAMAVRVRVEALPQYLIEGHVVSISPLPLVQRDLAGISTVKSYLGRIRLHSSPKGLMPGMTAEVEIHTDHADEALVVPAESVVAENGHEYCIVEKPGGLERREVTVGQASRELLEIRSGLTEGERVVRDPSLLDDDEEAEVASHPVPATPEDWGVGK